MDKIVRKYQKILLIIGILYNLIGLSQCNINYGKDVESGTIYLCNNSTYNDERVKEWFNTNGLTMDEVSFIPTGGVATNFPIPGINIKIEGDKIKINGHTNVAFDVSDPSTERVFEGVANFKKGNLAGASCNVNLPYRVVVRRAGRVNINPVNANLSICQNVTYTHDPTKTIFIELNHAAINPIINVTGLPPGITFVAESKNLIRVLGKTSKDGVYKYTMNLRSEGDCPETISVTGNITVNPEPQMLIFDQPKVCQNEPVYLTYSVKNVFKVKEVKGLPASVNVIYSQSLNMVVISGVFNESGTYNYEVSFTSLTSDCFKSIATSKGTITVTEAATVSTPSSIPELCINTVLTPITHNTSNTTGIGAAIGLPNGITASWSNNIITINGTPTKSGTFNYKIPLKGCGNLNATGTIIVKNSSVTPPSSEPTVCINSILTSITHTTTDVTGIGIPTGLPSGITASWSDNTITISGSPTESGIFNYKIPIIGGKCTDEEAKGMIIVNEINTVSTPSNQPSLCLNTTLTNITHTTTGATGIGIATGLPNGVIASWSNNVITISGTPTESGTFNYKVPLTGGCESIEAEGVISVNINNTISPPSSIPTLCINTPLVNITHITTGVTGIGMATGLPNGVTASWSNNTITISGIPTEMGTFNYEIPAIGGCTNTVSALGVITVTSGEAVTQPSSNPFLCINTPLINITHTTTGATGIEAGIGLPDGVTAVWNTNIITISGIPTENGVFDYRIPLIGSCGGNIEATGTITVGNTVSEASLNNISICENTVLPNITHTTAGATGIGAVTGLPNGVTAVWNANTITISGTPTEKGVFNYNIPLTGGCGNIISAEGVITIGNTVSEASNTNVNACINTILPNITHTTSGATDIGVATGLPNGVIASWSNNVITISGSPTEKGVFNYNIPLTGGCGNIISAEGIITVGSTVSEASNTNVNACINAAIPNITHTTTGVTGIEVATGLPNGVTAMWNANTITISGTPTENGVFDYRIPLSGSCGGNIEATGTITVGNTVSEASSNNTSICENTVLPNVTHTTTGATGIGAVTGLPNGVTAVWNANTITISGTPTEKGVFNYNIPLTGGCGNTISAEGIITIGNTVSEASNTNVNTCINTTIPNITHSTTGATGIGAVTGLPSGVTAVWSSNTITISGTPTESGSFNYRIPLSGGCGNTTVEAIGNIIVNNKISPPVIGTIEQPSCSSVTGAVNLSGLPSGNWTIEQSGSSTKTYNGSGNNFKVTNLISGTYNFIVKSGSCSSISSTNIEVNKIICAVNDDYTNSSLKGGGETKSILNNDTLNGNIVSSSSVILKTKSIPSGFTLDTSTGKIKIDTSVISGTYSIEYEICEIGVPENCDTAIVTVKIEDSCNEILNLITPDGNGENDTFFIPCIESFPNNRVRVFNRFGVLVYKAIGYNNTTVVFEGKSTEGGTINKSRGLPFGTYYYEIDYGNGKNKVGWLFINY